jgi:hypothetical protein
VQASLTLRVYDCESEDRRRGRWSMRTKTGQSAERQNTARRAAGCASARRPALRARPRGGLAALLVLPGVCLLLFAVLPAAAQQDGLPDEYTIKAVFLYNFGRYVEWPKKTFAGQSDPFVIAVVGQDPFGAVLDTIAAKKTIQGRRIVVRRFARADDYRPPCHILFVSSSLSSEEQAALLRKTEAAPVLVVGETPGFAERGAAANFFNEGNRIRFELNVNTARRAQLRMDAKLLSLGKPVGAGTAGPQ